MFSDAGPDVRWVGNEKGIAGDPAWATLNRDDFAPGEADEARLNRGDRPGTHWLPPECDVSIRPGWFHHASEDGKVKSPRELLDLYYQSVGRGASLLLNVPPDRRGRVHESDEASLRGFGELVAATFSTDLARGARAAASNVRGGAARFAAANVLDGRRDTYWATDDAVTTPEIVLDLDRPVTFNVVSLREHLPLGQRVEAWAIDAWHDGAWREIAGGTAIGSRRLWRGDDVTASRVRVRVTKAPVPPALSEIGLFREPAGARAAPR
jgi:alpha-L-fucosidase